MSQSPVRKPPLQLIGVDLVEIIEATARSLEISTEGQSIAISSMTILKGGMN
jgi:hypothetical protein